MELRLEKIDSTFPRSSHFSAIFLVTDAVYVVMLTC